MIGSSTYYLYPSTENHQKLVEVLQPFIGDADDTGQPGRNEQPAPAPRVAGAVDSEWDPVVG